MNGTDNSVTDFNSHALPPVQDGAPCQGGPFSQQKQQRPIFRSLAHADDAVATDELVSRLLLELD